MTVLGQRGFALAIILWFLAGMALLVSGIVYQARIDTRMAQLHLARATAESAGDGAILLMLADVVSRDLGNSTDNRPLSGSFTVGKQSVSVALVPLSGLINLQEASIGTLVKLFVTRGHLTSAEAQIIADNMVKWRATPSGALSGAPGDQFQSPEDVLQVAGMTRALRDSIRDVVVVHHSGASGGLDNSYRVDAIVSYGGRAWLRRKWVDLGGGSTNRLPWSFTRIEAPRVLSGDRSS